MRKKDVRNFIFNEGLFILLLFLMGGARILVGKNPFGDNLWHNVGLITTIRILMYLCIPLLRGIVDGVADAYNSLED